MKGLWRSLTILACLVGSVALATGPDIVVTLTVPQGTNITVVTETDSSGLYKITKVGPATWKLTNFDSKIAISYVHDANATSPGLVVVFGGLNGPDPLPSLDLSTIISGQTTNQTLSWGQSASCTACDLTLQETF